jgi:hypothetical protein
MTLPSLLRGGCPRDLGQSRFGGSQQILTLAGPLGRRQGLAAHHQTLAGEVLVGKKLF